MSRPLFFLLLALPLAAQTAPPLDARLRERLVTILDTAIAARVTPGAVLLVETADGARLEVARGRHTYAPSARAVRTSDRYDLASLTKVCATTPVILSLVADGTLALDRSLERAPFAAPGVTVRHLLTHSAGLPPFRRFYARPERGRALLGEVLGTTPVKPPGTETRYSDIGLMWLAALAEARTGKSLDTLAHERVFAPLGMAGATWATPSTPVDAPPTERCAFRKRLVSGAVHDENAWALGGVAGHAGLFATADDVARLARAFLGPGNPLELPADLLRAATVPASPVAGATRALGFATYGADLFGHTGFTGTLVRARRSDGRLLVLLTNRVHPSRGARGIGALRRRVLRSCGLARAR